MAKVFLVNVDFSKNELQNAKIHNLASAPSTPASGQIYYNTGDNTMYFYDGSSWIDMGGYTQEEIEDFVGAMVGGGSVQTGITVSYDDTNGELDFVVDTLDQLPSPTSDVDINSNKLTNVSTPTVSGDAANKQYVDDNVRTDEEIYDLAGGMVGGASVQTGITVTHDDANDELDFVVDTLDSLPSPTSDVDMNSQKVVNMAEPTASSDAATKNYVDAAVTGLEWKEAVVVATTANVDLDLDLENGDTIDGVTLSTGDRVLVKDQTAASENGIYVVSASGAASRSTDADSTDEVQSMAVFVNQGSTNANTAWLQTNDNVAVDTATPDDLIFVQFGGGSGGEVASYEATIGNNSDTSFGISHNLGTRDCVVQIYDTSSYDEVEADIVRTDTNTVTVSFTSAPATNAYRVVIHGVV